VDWRSAEPRGASVRSSVIMMKYKKAATPWLVSRILAIWVDPCAGLASLHLDKARRWLLALPVCGVY